MLGVFVARVRVEVENMKTNYNGRYRIEFCLWEGYLKKCLDYR